MQMIRQAVTDARAGLARVAIPVARLILARTRWRGRAADGQEFGFDLAHPLSHGAVVFESATHAYVIEQELEAVLEVELSGDAAIAARLGWSLGNLHQPVQALPGLLRAPDDAAVRAVLQSLGVPYRPARAVFTPAVAAHGHHHGPHA